MLHERLRGSRSERGIKVFSRQGVQVRFAQPVYVNLREGKVYAIAPSHRPRRGSVWEFRNIACHDSPVLISHE